MSDDERATFLLGCCDVRGSASENWVEKKSVVSDWPKLRYGEASLVMDFEAVMVVQQGASLSLA